MQNNSFKVWLLDLNKLTFAKIQIFNSIYVRISTACYIWLITTYPLGSS